MRIYVEDSLDKVSGSDGMTISDNEPTCFSRTLKPKSNLSNLLAEPEACSV